jgi:hypothetical protein
VDPSRDFDLKRPRLASSTLRRHHHGRRSRGLIRTRWALLALAVATTFVTLLLSKPA